jgi:WhiB family redox-sensing transcriptional regulator
MYDQHVTREQQGEALAHLSAVDGAPQTDSRAGAARSDCDNAIQNGARGVEVVPVDAGAAYVDATPADDVEPDDVEPDDTEHVAALSDETDSDETDSDETDSDETVSDETEPDLDVVRESVKPVLSLIAGFDQMFEEIEDQWQERALCAQTDPEAFFPEKGGSTREAKRICLGCEVKDECLEYALANDERFGIWGGLSERERRRLKRGIV